MNNLQTKNHVKVGSQLKRMKEKVIGKEMVKELRCHVDLKSSQDDGWRWGE